MSTGRFQVGMHRVGAVLAILVMAGTGLFYAAMASVILEGAGWVIWAVGAGVALAIYALCRGIGWIFAG